MARSSLLLLLLSWTLSACAGSSPPCPAAPTGTASSAQTRHGHSHDEHDHGHGHEHSHEPERDAPPGTTRPQQAVVIPHDSLRVFANNGNELRGVATPSQGASSYEVWRTSVAVGSSTPPHRHESEEVFVFLRGKGRAVIGDQVLEFEAPATVIAPAGVSHQFFNIGEEPTDAIVIVGIGSTIYDANGQPMDLPWRR